MGRTILRHPWRALTMVGLGVRDGWRRANGRPSCLASEVVRAYRRWEIQDHGASSPLVTAYDDFLRADEAAQVAWVALAADLDRR